MTYYSPILPSITPGGVVTVTVPGPTIEKRVEVPVQVPGPERVVQVPGPERIVEVPTIKYVDRPGPERIVVQEVPGPERVIVKEVPGQCPPSPGPAPRDDVEPHDQLPPVVVPPVQPVEPPVVHPVEEQLCRLATGLSGDATGYCREADSLLNACAHRPSDDQLSIAMSVHAPANASDIKALRFNIALASALETIATAADLYPWFKPKGQDFAVRQLAAFGSGDAVARLLTVLAEHESAFNPNARNPRSTATGYWQMLEATRTGLTQWDKALPQWPTVPAGSTLPVSPCDQGAYEGVLVARFLYRNGLIMTWRPGMSVMTGDNAEATRKLKNISDALAAAGVRVDHATQAQACLYCWHAVGSGHTEDQSVSDPDWKGVASRAASAVRNAQ